MISTYSCKPLCLNPFSGGHILCPPLCDVCTAAGIIMSHYYWCHHILRLSALEFTKTRQIILVNLHLLLIFLLPSVGGFRIQIPVSLKIPDTCNLISSTCCLAADRWESGAVQKKKNHNKTSKLLCYRALPGEGGWILTCFLLSPPAMLLLLPLLLSPGGSSPLSILHS